MGNGTSQSVMLGSSRSLGHSMHPARFEKSPAKYAHPNNRVLPKPIAGQRLRSTDNGHILASAGTIRGRKSISPIPQEQDEADPQVLDILKRRSEMIEREHDSNLRNYRMFHSDPDISQSRLTIGFSPEVPETLQSRRTGGGVANKTNKLKQRKKTRAPEPPPSDGFHGQYQRRAQSAMDLSQSRGNECSCVNGLSDWKIKSRAPPPPPLLIKPPPPDPPPPPEIKYAIKKIESPTNVANQKVRKADDAPFSNGNISRSIGDLRSVSAEPRTTTVFDSKTNLTRITNKPALLAQKPDPFQKEIEAVTKKIARGLDGVISTKVKSEKASESQKLITPKQYYFSDKDVFRTDATNKTSSALVNGNNGQTSRAQNGKTVLSNVKHVSTEKPNKNVQSGKKLPMRDQSPLERFSPNRKRIKSPIKCTNGEHRNGISQRDGRSDIDVRLRPVLPRKTPDLASFSPSEAWQALEPDEANGTSRSNSDESMPCQNRTSPEYYKHRQFNDFRGRPGSSGHTSRAYSSIENQWTPRQDLDDSDTSSMDSDDAVIPKSQLGEFPTTFSLPTVMFSNMRPIGSDISSSKRVIHNYRNFNKDSSLAYGQMKSKPYKGAFANSDINASSHFKKFLGMRNKYLSEEDVSVSDSNWTFGGHGLQQKRGKQYSSDLMLNDKRKYELVVQNHFGEVLGDILVTKSKDMKNNNRQSNSKGPDISFYSTEGHVMYLPKSKDSDNYSVDSRGTYSKLDQSAPFLGKHRVYSEFEKNSSFDLVRMLEDDARRRRSKEKMGIRKQLRLMKQLDTEDEETEEEIDEAYFTEPKSLEGSSPLYFPSRELRYYPDMRKDALSNRGPSSLTHWTSSPSLLNNVAGKPNSTNGFVSSSSITSSPDLLPWQKPTNVADRWMQRKQQSQSRRHAERRVSEGDSSPVMSRLDSSEPSPSNKEHRRATGHTKEKKPSIYKQLMDIVRKEERAMKKEEEGRYDPAASRESSYSQRESSHSSSSHDSVSSSYSDSSGQGLSGGKSGMPANNEFHTSTTLGMQRSPDSLQGRSPQPFQAAFAQPFATNKGYRPVPFDVSVPAGVINCRMPTLQEGHKVQAEVS